MTHGVKTCCPVSLHYVDKYERAPPSELEAVKNVAYLTGSEFVIHPGAGHGYMMHSRNNDDAEAARKSWERALQMIGALRTEPAPEYPRAVDTDQSVSYAAPVHGVVSFFSCQCQRESE